MKNQLPPMVAYLKAAKHTIGRKRAKKLLAEEGGDVEKALARLRKEYGR